MRGHSGFTLVELLVVIAIITGMMGILIPQVNNFQKAQSLQNAASDLASNIKAARNRATSGVKCSEDTPALSWSIRFPASPSNTYVLETVLETTCNNPDLPVTSPVVTYPFPGGTGITGYEITKSGGVPETCSTAYPVAVSFGNISGEINFKKDLLEGCGMQNAQKMEIILVQTDNPDKTVRVIIDKGGSINVAKD